MIINLEEEDKSYAEYKGHYGIELRDLYKDPLFYYHEYSTLPRYQRISFSTLENSYLFHMWINDGSCWYHHSDYYAQLSNTEYNERTYYCDYVSPRDLHLLRKYNR